MLWRGGNVSGVIWRKGTVNYSVSPPPKYDDRWIKSRSWVPSGYWARCEMSVCLGAWKWIFVSPSIWKRSLAKCAPSSRTQKSAAPILETSWEATQKSITSWLRLPRDHGYHEASLVNSCTFGNDIAENRASNFASCPWNHNRLIICIGRGKGYFSSRINYHSCSVSGFHLIP